MRKPRLDEDRGVAMGRSSVARHRWPAATVLHQGLHFPGSSSCERSEKTEERRDHKKRPPENPNLTDSRVCWPLGRLESLHFCRVGGLNKTADTDQRQRQTETHRDRDRYRERPRQRLARADVNALSVAEAVAASVALDVTVAVSVISSTQCHSYRHTHVKATGNMYVALAQAAAR